MECINDLQLPKGWVETTLGNVVTLSDKKVEPSALEEVPYVGLEHIEKDTGRLLEFGTSSEVKSTKSKFNTGDLLYGKLRPYLNKVAYVDFGGVCSTDILVFKKNPYISNKFLSFRFLSKDFVRYASQNVNGVQHPRVNFQTLSEFPISLPPLNEQHRIVAKIEALKARSACVKDSLSTIPALLDQFRQSVLAAAFRGDLTAEWRSQNSNVEPASVLLEKIRAELELINQKKKSEKNNNFSLLDQSFINDTFPSLPTSWKITQIRTICTNSFYGPRFAKHEYVTDGIPSIRTTDMTDDGEIILQNSPNINVPQDKLDDFKVLPGDLLITRSGSIGMMAVFWGSYIAIPSAYLIRFRFSKLVDVDYIFYYLKSPIGQKMLGLNSTSVTQSNINAEAIKDMPIPVPPLSEQKQIVCQIKSILQKVSLFKQKYQQTKDDIKQLDQSILSQAFSGNLVPQDPNDEPASVLLQRIRAQREKTLTPKTKRTKKTNPVSQPTQMELEL
jgi:type I restriction enzyme, S subunit